MGEHLMLVLLGDNVMAFLTVSWTDAVAVKTSLDSSFCRRRTTLLSRILSAMS